MLTTKLIPSSLLFSRFLRVNNMLYSGIIRKNREPSMFCHQCAQTADGLYCDKESICHKSIEQSRLQGLVLYLNQTISQYISLINKSSINCDTIPYAEYLLETTFSTLTNVNFDESQAIGYISKLTSLKDDLKACLDKKNIAIPQHLKANDFIFKNDADYLTVEGWKHAVCNRYEKESNPDVFSIQEFIRYALKGASAYLSHTERIRSIYKKPIPDYTDKDRKEIFDGMTRAWCKMAEPKQSLDDVFNECMLLGGINLKIMRALSNAHATAYGVPEPSIVPTRPIPGPAIMVSGHDMTDLQEVLEVTKDKGINVYTHGEMAPGNSYPELKKHKHLKGNLGIAWYNQGKDFAKFKGAILMTSNCLIPPKPAYKDRLFTTGSVGFKDVPHIGPERFNELIDCALKKEKFDQDYIDKNYPSELCRNLTVGYGYQAVLGLADIIVNSIKSGALKKIFLIGGCDGFEPSRKYFTDIAVASPKESLILTMGCAKFRVNQLELGNLGDTGIPRVLDMGQCNDSYAAVVVALELAKALGTNVNDLPLYYALAWFEQKAVAVLSTMLHLGIRNIRLGPMAPAFLTNNVMNLLQEKFNLHAARPKEALDDLSVMYKERGESLLA